MGTTSKRIEVYWDNDGNGWAWRYEGRSGGIWHLVGQNRSTPASHLAFLARDEVVSDTVLQLSVDEVARLDVAVFDANSAITQPTVFEGETADVTDPRD